MMMLRNPLYPAPYRPVDKPGNAARQDDGGDLDQIGKDENFINRCFSNCSKCANTSCQIDTVSILASPVR